MENISAELKVLGYADFRQRLHAFAVDYLIFIPLGMLTAYNLLHGKNFNIEIVATLIWFIYKPYMEWKYGATFGKIAAKIRVVDANMKFPPFNQVMMRFLPYFAVGLSGLFVNYSVFCSDAFLTAKTLDEINVIKENVPIEGAFFSLLFFIGSVTLIFFDDKKRALHDKFSECYCVSIDKIELPD